VKAKQSFGGACSLHIQGSKSKPRNKQRMKKIANRFAALLLSLVFNPEDGDDMSLQNVL
jgi:hypothetical protein